MVEERKKHLLITGGAGYIGSATAYACIHAGYRVTVIDNLECGFREAIPAEADFVEGDICNQETLETLFKNQVFDAVLHLAALKSVEESEQDPARYYRVNVQGTQSILDAMHKYGVHRIIFSSSASVYGNGKSTAFSEEDPLDPYSVYAKTKRDGEILITSAAEKSEKITSVIFRYFNVVGKSYYAPVSHQSKATLFGAILESLQNKSTFYLRGNDYDTPDGTCIRDFVHVDDIADAHVRALENPVCGTYNLGSGTGISVQEVVHAFEEALGKSLSVCIESRRPGDVPFSCAHFGKAQRDLSWSPQYGLKDMVASSVFHQKKILLIITKGTIGGAQTFVLDFARKLQKCDVSVTVGFGEGVYLEKECEKYSIPTHTFKWLGRSYNPLSNLLFIFEARRFIARSSFSIVHVNSTNALLAVIAAKSVAKSIKTIFTFHGLSFLERSARVSILIKIPFWLVTKLALWFVDEAVFVSKANMALAQKLHLTRGGSVVYNGLDPDAIDFLEKETARAELEKFTKKKLRGSIVVGSIGRLSDEKNYEFLIQFWTQYKEKLQGVQLVLIGSGPQYTHLQELVTKNGLSDVCTLVGEVPDARRYLKAFDVFVLTSRYEGMSISILESLFAGVSAVVSDVGGAREQLPRPDVQVFTSEDMEDFYQKLSVFVTDTKMRERVAQESKEQYARFLLADMVNAYMCLYK